MRPSKGKSSNVTPGPSAASSSQVRLLAGSNETGPDGLLKDITVVDVDEPGPVKKSRADRSQDIDTFFSPSFIKDGKKYRNCTPCTKLQKRPVSFVNEATTLQWHQQATHKADYLKWAAANNFPSMLPQDTKQQRDAVTASKQPQTSLDSHLVSKPQLSIS
ncbi:hypothetical protein JVT61DRAFT_7835 [Boletus reticuloceps]|uniref:Uncharacterized protein n=1 Tax=Boletus reticuloceps TaxID=495285 RepID=A0A8I3A7F8_9AGAM|nr:hypothetical protein JVT61DRAFT_7835 [Boletus reticuloceps]